MTHSHVRRRLSAYLEGDLAPGEEDSLEAHLTECASCAAELRALRRAIDLLHSLPKPAPPHDLGAAVIERLRAGEGAPARGPLSAWWAGAGSSMGWLVPVAAAIGIGAVAWLPTPEPDPGGGPLASTASAGPLPSIASCLERPLRSDPTRDDCAPWYSWFVEVALADASAFAHEVDRLPPTSRDRWLRRVYEFAARSGSATLVGDRLRSSREPRAVRIAQRFERGSGGLVRQVGFNR